MLGRRFVVLVLVLMGLTALAASVAPRQPATPREQTESTATPAPAGSPTFTTVERELTFTDSDEVERVEVNAGDLVQLTVSGDARDGVMLLNRIEAIDPVSPARFSVLASEPGEHPIELVDADREIGTLVIRD
jgi:hypothetical protein